MPFLVDFATDSRGEPHCVLLGVGPHAARDLMRMAQRAGEIFQIRGNGPYNIRKEQIPYFFERYVEHQPLAEKTIIGARVHFRTHDLFAAHAIPSREFPQSRCRRRFQLRRILYLLPARAVPLPFTFFF